MLRIRPACGGYCCAIRRGCILYSPSQNILTRFTPASDRFVYWMKGLSIPEAEWDDYRVLVKQIEAHPAP